MSIENAGLLCDRCPARITEVLIGERRGRSLGSATVNHQCEKISFTINTEVTPNPDEARVITGARLAILGVGENCDFGSMTPAEYQQYLDNYRATKALPFPE